MLKEKIKDNKLLKRKRKKDNMKKPPLSELEQTLAPRQTICFKNGEEWTVVRYDKDLHRVALSSGCIEHLYSIYDDILEIKPFSDLTVNNCCMCLRFKDFDSMTEAEFIHYMKLQYVLINPHKLSDRIVRSWEDEYLQIKKYFLPILKKQNKSFVNFHIIFELKLALDPADIDSGKFVYSDAVIVSDDGFVVLEFKQYDFDIVETYWREANKYLKRLKRHKIGTKQHLKFVYMICTKANRDGVYPFKKARNFWYGNAKSVANDLCNNFFAKTKPFKDIEKWLSAGFWEKKQKSN